MKKTLFLLSCLSLYSVAHAQVTQFGLLGKSNILVTYSECRGLDDSSQGVACEEFKTFLPTNITMEEGQVLFVTSAEVGDVKVGYGNTNAYGNGCWLGPARGDVQSALNFKFYNTSPGHIICSFAIGK